MESSLSVILAAHNAEATLARQVTDILDVLPELTSGFELVIVDDGSNDQTEDVGRELATEFPQVRFVRHSSHSGIPAVAHTGMQHTSGEVVIVHDQDERLTPGDLKRLWELREEEDLVMARVESMPSDANASSLRRMFEWGWSDSESRRKSRSHEGAKLIRRSAIVDFPDHAALASRRVSNHIERIDVAEKQVQHDAPPNFLIRLRNLALGE